MAYRKQPIPPPHDQQKPAPPPAPPRPFDQQRLMDENKRLKLMLVKIRTELKEYSNCPDPDCQVDFDLDSREPRQAHVYGCFYKELLEMEL